MFRYIIRNDNHQDYEFFGRLIAKASTKNNFEINLSRKDCNWQEIDIYLTKGGVYVLSVLKNSISEKSGLRTTQKAMIFNEKSEVINFLKKQLYNYTATLNNLLKLIN